MTLKASMLLCVTAVAAASSAAYAADTAVDEAHQTTTVYAAGDQGEIRHSTTVRAEHVNFHRPREVAALYDRITYAANQVCTPRSLTGAYYTSPGYVRCYTKAVDDAVASVNRPELSTYHQQHLASSSRLASK